MSYSEPELFGRVTVELHAHIAWSMGVGWTLWVNSRLDGLPFAAGEGDQYGPLELEELLTLLDAVLPAAYLGSRYRT